MAKITYTDKTVGSKFKADDANEIKTSVNSLYDDKVDKVEGKGLSEEDYSSTEKTKLAGIEDEANKTLFATESEVVERTLATKAVTPLSLAATLDKIDQLYNSSTVAEDRERRANVAWTYTGTVRMVGVGQTYSTISAAITAAVSGDIIQLIDGTYNMASESGGYLLINSTTKRLLIRGNAANNAAVILQQTSAASYCVRLRSANQVTFQNVTITSNQVNSAVLMNMGTPSEPVTCLFDNCILENTNAAAVNTVTIGDTLSNNNYFEFKNCTIYSNNHASSHPLAVLPVITDALAATYTNPLLITGCDVYGWISFGDSAINFTAYDSAFIQRQLNSPYILSFGQDTSVPVNVGAVIDIRSCSVKDENAFSGHAILFGRGTKQIYCVNNYVFVGPTNDFLALGIVIKSTPTTLGNVVIDGNYIEAPRPLYVKGAVKCYIRYNQAVSNWSDLTSGYGFELNNPNDSGTVASTGNVITNNNLMGNIGAMWFSTASGATNAGDSAKLCFFNKNIYTVPDGTVYIQNDATVVNWINRGNFWTQDTNSRFIVL